MTRPEKRSEPNDFVTPNEPLQHPTMLTQLDNSHDDDDDDDVDIARYVHGVRKRWWMIALAALVGTLVLTAWAWRLPKLYRTAATVLIETSTPKVLTGVSEVVPVGGGGWWANKDFYEREYLVIKSRQVALLAAERLELSPEKAKVEDLSTLLFGKYQVAAEKTAPGVVQISVTDTDPEYAKNVANAVAYAFAEHNLKTRIEGTEDASRWLSIQQRDLKTKLETSEDSLYAFMAEQDVLNASLDSQLEEVTGRLKAFNESLAETQAEIIRKRLDGKAVREAKENPQMLDSLSAVQGALVVNSLKTKLIDARTERSRYAADRYKDKHPKMVALAEQISALESELEHELSSILVALTRAQENLASTEAGLKAAIAGERAREARLNKMALDYKRREREVETNEKLFEMVTSRMKEADLSGAMRFNNVRVLDDARVPAQPFAPQISKYAVMGLLLGLFLGVMIALALEILDNTIKNHLDIENTLKIPFLGLVPIIAGEDAVQLDPKERDQHIYHLPKSQAAECVRFIRTNLLFMSSEKPLHTIVVTSAMPRDGKTTTAISLAMTFAQAGSRTLLVDTDMRRPRIHRSFGIPSVTGLSSVLLGQNTLDEVIKETMQPGLDVLICGPTPPNPSELLHTRRFHDLVDDLKGRYDHIIFDSSPVGAVTDPVILSKMCEGTVLVYKANVTSREMAKQSLRSLRDANVRILGAILNDVDLTARTYGNYSYQYYSKYRSYSEDD